MNNHPVTPLQNIIHPHRHALELVRFPMQQSLSIRLKILALFSSSSSAAVTRPGKIVPSFPRLQQIVQDGNPYEGSDEGAVAKPTQCRPPVQEAQKHRTSPRTLPPASSSRHLSSFSSADEARRTTTSRVSSRVTSRSKSRTTASSPGQAIVFINVSYSPSCIHD